MHCSGASPCCQLLRLLRFLLLTQLGCPAPLPAGRASLPCLSQLLLPLLPLLKLRLPHRRLRRLL